MQHLSSISTIITTNTGYLTCTDITQWYIVLTVFNRGGLLIKAWTDADLRGGTPLLAGNGCNGGTVSIFEELLTAGVTALVVSAGLTSLTDECLRATNELRIIKIYSKYVYAHSKITVV